MKINKEVIDRKDNRNPYPISKEIEINENNIQYLNEFHYTDDKSDHQQIQIIFSNELYIVTFDFPYKKLKERLSKFSEYVDDYNNKYLVNNNLIAYIEVEPEFKNRTKFIHFTDGNYIRVE